MTSIRSAFRPTRHATATGSGSASCRRIVELLQLRLDVESEVGKGTVFAHRCRREERWPNSSPPPRRRARVRPGAARTRAARRTSTHACGMQYWPLLKVEGYDVLAASGLTGRAAALVKQEPCDIGLLITGLPPGFRRNRRSRDLAVRWCREKQLPAVLMNWRHIGSSRSAMSRWTCICATASKTDFNPDLPLALLRELLNINRGMHHELSRSPQIPVAIRDEALQPCAPLRKAAALAARANGAHRRHMRRTSRRKCWTRPAEQRRHPRERENSRKVMSRVR